MRVVDARDPDEPEFVVATAVCKHCEEAIEKWCIPLLIDGQTYPPAYEWKHARDGVVMCEWLKVASPREGTIRDEPPAAT